MLRIRASLALTCAMFTSCSGEAAKSPSSAASNSSPSQNSAIEGERPVRDLRIGAGTDDIEFVDISSLALDGARGILYVADAGAHSVLVFDSLGVQVARIGRRGEGPGEFNRPTGLVLDANARLLVRDARGVHTFVARAGLPFATEFASFRHSPPFSDWMLDEPGFVDSEANYYFPKRQTRAPSLVYDAVDTGGQVVRRVPVPGFDSVTTVVSVWTSAQSGRVVPGLESLPFEGRPSQIITKTGSVLFNSSNEYVVEEDAAGGGRQLVRRSVAATAIDPSERDDSLNALRARLRQLETMPGEVRGLRSDVRDLRIPRTAPAIYDLSLTRQENLVVRRWPSTAGASTSSPFDIWTPEGGRELATWNPSTKLHRRPQVVVDCRSLAGVMEDAATGEHTVAWFFFKGPCL